MQKIVLFTDRLVTIGGLQRLMAEEAAFFTGHGYEVTVLTFALGKDNLFKNIDSVRIIKINDSKSYVIQNTRRIRALQKTLKEIKPDVIIAQMPMDAVLLYLATFASPFSYATHIHETVFWSPEDPHKYAFIHRRAFNLIRESIPSRKRSMPSSAPKMGLTGRVKMELTAFMMYLAVRKAVAIFTLSSTMQREIQKIYGCQAYVLRGAFPNEIFNFKSKLDLRKKLGLENKRIVLNVNRLDPKKRVDLLIQAFEHISRELIDVVLLIGGTGPDEARLRHLVNELGMQDKIIFLGRIPDNELWDYLFNCDVFANSDCADFAIAPFEALALGRTVIWGSEMETDPALTRSKHIFPAEPTPAGYADALGKALKADNASQQPDDLSGYTWDAYFSAMEKVLHQRLSDRA